MTSRLPLRPAALLAAALLALAACGDAGSPAASDGVASLDEAAATTGENGDDPPAEADTVEAPEDPDLAYALYDECLADAGFDLGTTFTAGDGDSGVITLDELELDDGSDPQLGELDFGEDFAAIEAECSRHLDGLDLSFEISAEEQAVLEDAQLAWASCMRENGIDVPDVDITGSGNVQVFGGPDDASDPQAGGGFADPDFDVEAFQEANATCNVAFEEVLRSADLPAEEGR